MLDSRIPDGLTEIRAGWCLDDVVHAHQLLDELDRVALFDAARAKVTRG